MTYSCIKNHDLVAIPHKNLCAFVLHTFNMSWENDMLLRNIAEIVSSSLPFLSCVASLFVCCMMIIVPSDSLHPTMTSQKLPVHFHSFFVCSLCYRPYMCDDYSFLWLSFDYIQDFMEG